VHDCPVAADRPIDRRGAGWDVAPQLEVAVRQLVPIEEDLHQSEVGSAAD
jgi:hypothetical protein